MANTLNTIEVPSVDTEPKEYESLELPEVGEWLIQSQSPNYQIIAKLSEGADTQITNSERGLICKVKTAPATIYLQSTCPKGTTSKVQYTNFFFHKLVGCNGGGGGGTAYTFSQPLSESGGTVSLQITNNLKLTGGKLDVGDSVVLTSGNQSIAGVKTFAETLILRGTARGSGNLKLERPENEPVYISLGNQTNDSSIAYFGFLSSNSTTFAFENLKSGGTFEFRNPVVFNGAISNNKQFVTKEYVDNKIQVRTLAQGTEPEASSIPNGGFVAVIYS